MSNVFISHSSADDDVARRLAERLRAAGYESLFLDFDSANGIPAGGEWERVLYRRLKACRAVLALCSEAFMSSKWCFAEVTQARALGKVLIPVKIGACRVDPILADRQVVDLTIDEEAGFLRLLHGLEAAGVADDPSWDPRRRPYPGLAAFTKDDSAVFFGREEETNQILESLGRMRRQGEPRLALILGASGCGKSSLMHAGVLPRLARDKEHWLVVPPFRPWGRPLVGLAQSLAAIFPKGGRERGWRELHGELSGADGASTLGTIALDLIDVAGAREASVLLAVDQLEEVLAPSEEDEAATFLRLLSTALGVRSSPLFMLATLRSDFLGVFQRRPEMVDLAFDDQPLGPLPATRLARVIEGPAERAGIEFDPPGLVLQMVADTATDDALPLLAFTLREMWERSGERFTAEVYEKQLGTVRGAIARSADEILARRPPSLEEEAALRDAFLELVRLDDEGRHARQPARWDDLPKAARPILDRFVEARLLVVRAEGGERTVEVAHEALFRVWQRLADWLAEEREFLLWRRRFEIAASEWEASGRDRGALLRDARLVEADRWLGARSERALAPVEADLVAASRAERHRVERRRRWITGGSIAAAAVFLAVAVLAVLQSLRADRERRLVVARDLATQAAAVLDDTAGGLERSLLLATESLRSSWTRDGYAAWVRAIGLLPRRPEPLVGAGGPALAIALHPDQPTLALGGQEGVRLLDLAMSREPSTLDASGPVDVLAFGTGGAFLAGGGGHEVTVWHVETGRPRWRIENLEQVVDLAFGDRLLAIADRSTQVRLLDTETGEVTVLDQEGRVLTATFVTRNAVPRHRATENPTTTLSRVIPHLVMAGVIELSVWDGIHSWSISLGSRSSGTIWALAYEPVVDTLAVADQRELFFARNFRFGAEQYSRLLELETAESPRSMPPFSISDRISSVVRTEPDRVEALVFSPDGRWLATGGRNGLVRVRTAESGAEWSRLQASGPVTSLAFTADGSGLILPGPEPSILKVTDTWASLTIRLPEPATAVAFSPDGGRFAFAERSGGVHLVEVPSGRRLLEPVPLGERIEPLAFAPAGRWLVAIGRDNVHVIDLSSMSRTAHLRQEGPLDSAALSPDGRWIATHTPPVFGRGDGLKRASRTRIWELSTGDEVAWRSHEDDDLTHAHRSDHWKPLPNSLDSGSLPLGEGGRLDLLEASAEWLPVAFGNKAATPDGRWRAHIEVGNVFLLEPQTGRKIVQILLPENAGALGVAFSPDGRWLATASGEPPPPTPVTGGGGDEEIGPTGAVRLWRIGPVNDLIAESCRRLSRNLAPSEWTLYSGSSPRETCPELPTAAPE